jgi:2-dehydro-3-deoxygluconokinase
MTDVVTLGECLVSLVATRPGPLADATSFDRFVAGAEANVAVGLARLGCGAAYIGRVGDDGFGETIRRHLRGEGVDTTHLSTDPDAPTGVMVRERPGLVPAQVLYLRRDSAGSRLAVADIDAAAADGVFEGARWLHLTGITPAVSASARVATARAAAIARETGLTISLDLNLRRRLWSDATAAPVLRELAAHADVLFGSDDELAVLAGIPQRDAAEHDPAGLARACLDVGPRVVVAKLGGGGATIVARDEIDAIHRPAVPLVAVVDPVGAGDAFCAGFIAARLDGAELAESLEIANACGAAAAAALGDQTGLPSPEQVAAIRHAHTTGGGPDTVR